ncbi:hypothetical protein AFLA_009067 [Aspergillus flavus NRRL3357]|nr:hypothetical protein AFLA_009067 [Aspergillus flavus NRRL3357]
MVLDPKGLYMCICVYVNKLPKKDRLQPPKKLLIACFLLAILSSSYPPCLLFSHHPPLPLWLSQFYYLFLLVLRSPNFTTPLHVR